MASLYQISSDIRSSIADILAMDDIPENAIADTVESLTGELVEKQVSVAAYIMNLRSDVLAMKDYEEEMSKRRKTLEGRIDRLSDSLMASMLLNRQSNVPCLEMSIKLKKGRRRVIVHDESALPDEFFIVSKSANKVAINEALKLDIKVPGASLEGNREVLEIK